MLPINAEFKDEKIYVIHQKHDGEYEIFSELEVKDGYVSIDVDELSPFVVTLDDPNIQSNETLLITSNVKNNGNYNWIILVAAIGFAAFVGVSGYLLIKKYKDVYAK